MTDVRQWRLFSLNHRKRDLIHVNWQSVRSDDGAIMAASKISMNGLYEFGAGTPLARVERLPCAGARSS
jgi:hypothetical protein